MSRWRPTVGTALAREWRSLDHDGSAVAVLGDIGWVVLAMFVALLAERAVARGLGRRSEPIPCGNVQTDRNWAIWSAWCCAIWPGSRSSMRSFLARRSGMYCRRWVSPRFCRSWPPTSQFRWRVAVVVLRAVLRPGEPPGPADRYIRRRGAPTRAVSVGDDSHDDRPCRLRPPRIDGRGWGCSTPRDRPSSTRS